MIPYLKNKFVLKLFRFEYYDLFYNFYFTYYLTMVFPKNNKVLLDVYNIYNIFV